MKKYIFCLMLTILFLTCTDTKQAGAYSVTVEEDSIYAKAIPSYIMKNVAPMFKKHVRKSMKYYDKYKDADAYTYANEIPDEYRNFIEKAKKIQDSDEITIHYPFYIYHADAEEYGNHYYFVAERNHKRLCIFRITVDTEDGRTYTYYDKVMDQYFQLDGNMAEDTLFYQIGSVVYAETPKKRNIVRDTTEYGMKTMEGVGDDSSDMGGAVFEQKEYEGKKDVIFSYLNRIKKGKVAKKSNKNIKLELKDEYTEPESISDSPFNTQEPGGRKVYIFAACVSALFLCILVVGFIRKR